MNKKDRYRNVSKNYSEPSKSEKFMKAKMSIGKDIVEFGFHMDKSDGGWVYVNGKIIQHRMHPKDVIQALILIAKANDFEVSTDYDYK